MYVLLSSCGNISYGANPFMSVYGVPTSWVKVNSLEEASMNCLQYIDEYELGGSEFDGGFVVDEPLAEQLIALISYNGRIWNGEDNQELYERRKKEAVWGNDNA